MLAKGTFNEDDIAPITNRSIRLVLEFPGPLLQYPMSSWHFLLIVMATDSMVFHWIWTGIDVDNPQTHASRVERNGKKKAHSGT